MGDHNRVTTHKDRFFVNRNTNLTVVNNQLLATRDTWLTWFMVNRSFNKSVDHRSYAEVLKLVVKELQLKVETTTLMHIVAMEVN